MFVDSEPRDDEVNAMKENDETKKKRKSVKLNDDARKNQKRMTRRLSKKMNEKDSKDNYVFVCAKKNKYIYSKQ